MENNFSLQPPFLRVHSVLGTSVSPGCHEQERCIIQIAEIMLLWEDCARVIDPNGESHCHTVNFG